MQEVLSVTPNERVALCVTCLVDQIMPEIGVASVRLLRRAGVAVAFPEQQTCCGQPFFNSGFEPEAIRLAKRTIATFEPYEAVVIPSGSCTAMIRVEYPHLLHGEPDWHHRALKLAEKTFELSQYLGKVAGTQVASGQARAELSEASAGEGDERKVTYHDSCHMCRLLGEKESPRKALQGAGCELIEMAEPDRCCGFGGLFSLRMAEVSNAMTEEKLRQAKETGAELLVTADPGCLMQMRGLVQEEGLRVVHIATLLEERSRISEDDPSSD